MQDTTFRDTSPGRGDGALQVSNGGQAAAERLQIRSTVGRGFALSAFREDSAIYLDVIQTSVNDTNFTYAVQNEGFQGSFLPLSDAPPQIPNITDDRFVALRQVLTPAMCQTLFACNDCQRAC